MLARDVMTTRVITVQPDTPVEEIARLLLDSRISGVPVLDGDGEIVGLVSEGDLIRRAAGRQGSVLAALVGGSPREADATRPGGRVARDVMSKTVTIVEEDTPVADIAVLLEKRRIKRVPVVRKGTLVGIVSRANLLHGLAAFSFTRSAAGDDRRIRSAVLERLCSEAGIDDRFVNVTVSNGIVHLWGAVESEQKREAARQVAANTPGVRAVNDHLGVLIPELLS